MSYSFLEKVQKLNKEKFGDTVRVPEINYTKKAGGVNFLGELEDKVFVFIRKSCAGLRAELNTKERLDCTDRDGTSHRENEIPINMQKDIDRLVLESAFARFFESGKKEDAFDIYFCYIEMFIGDYNKNTEKIVELLSEFESNGSNLLMKHRDHYTHSVYVFAIGLAIFESNKEFRDTYKKFYKSQIETMKNDISMTYAHNAGISDDNVAAHHFLKYWGLTALFHDIGYPFELPFEQVESYFEVNNKERKEEPYVAYHNIDPFININKKMSRKISLMYNDTEASFDTTNELFAYALSKKFAETYRFSREQMNKCLGLKATNPNEFDFFMDHAYFSATLLFQKIFQSEIIDLNLEYMDVLTAILIHNSLYKFKIAYYRKEGNIPLKAEIHPLAYLLMLCDELQCWDRTAYGRNSKKELHPMGARFAFDNVNINITYYFDDSEKYKELKYKEEFDEWYKKAVPSENPDYKDWKKKRPVLKAFSNFYNGNGKEKSIFVNDIKDIVNLEFGTKINVDYKFEKIKPNRVKSYISDSNFTNLNNFAIVLNAGYEDYKEFRTIDFSEEKEIRDGKMEEKYSDAFAKMSLEYKISNINQAKSFAEYMDAIDCFYTNKPVGHELVEEFTSDEEEVIRFMTYKRWLKERYEMGWTFGNDNGNKYITRRHERMLKDYIYNEEDFDIDDNYNSKIDAKIKEKYKQLDETYREKDIAQVKLMLQLLKLYDGLRIYRLRHKIEKR